MKEKIIEELPAMTPNEIRQLLGLESITGLGTTNISNCKICGAPVGSSKYCEYCGTHY